MERRSFLRLMAVASIAPTAMLAGTPKEEFTFISIGGPESDFSPTGSVLTKAKLDQIYDVLTKESRKIWYERDLAVWRELAT